MKRQKTANVFTRAICIFLAICMLAGAIPARAMAAENGIDVSKWQGAIDWQTVAQSGVQFAFIRVGTSAGLDEYFYYNMIAAQQAGIKTGVYIYSHAMNVDEAAQDALFVLNAIRDVQVTYPVVWDIESNRQKKLPPDTLALMANTFCAIIESEGYYPMVYSSTSWFQNVLGPIAYDKWVAHWYVPVCGIPDAAVWQYSDKGSIPGIIGDVDLDVAIKDFSSSIVNTGWVARKGFLYFYINYKMYRGWLDLGTAKYYLDPLGRMVTGWLLLEDGIYFMQPDGTMSVGLVPIGLGMYCFGEDGKMLTGLQAINGLIYYFTPEGVMYVGFLDLPDGRRFFDVDGHMLTGMNVLDGKAYYFDTNGIMLTGLQILGGNTYYFDATGAMQTGLQIIGGKTYYFDATGAMQTGLQIIGGKTYYFDATGVMQTGLQIIGGKTYLFDATGAMQTGVVAMNGLLYLFGPDGAMYTGWFNDGISMKYYEADGHMAFGLVTIDGSIYYFDTNGNMQTGIVDVGGVPYIFGVDGKMVVPVAGN